MVSYSSLDENLVLFFRVSSPTFVVESQFHERSWPLDQAWIGDVGKACVTIHNKLKGGSLLPSSPALLPLLLQLLYYCYY